MSDVVIGRPADAPDVFRPLTILLLLAIGILGFSGMLVLGAYAPDLGAQGNGGGHALSSSAVGYSGLIRLAEATGRGPHVIRDTRLWAGETLLVATPESGAVEIGDLLHARQNRPLLIILPKWQTIKDDAHPGWVRISDLLPADDPERMLSPGITLDVQRHTGGGALIDAPALSAIRFAAPAKLQVVESASPSAQGRPRLQPLIVDKDGGTVLGRFDGGSVYLLSDPDLLDNAGMKDPAGAASALALLDWLNGPHATSIGFDVTLNGLGLTRSPLKLMFDPPFLATTLAIVASMLLLGIHAFGRFGAPRQHERAIAFGKTALVDNSAALVRKAGRAHRLGGRYAAVIRDGTVRAFGVSPRLKGAAIDAYLDGMGEGPSFTALALAAENATDQQSLLAAARALHAWQQERQG